MISSLSFVFEEEIVKTLREAKCYTLMADESADEANTNQFAIVVRYLLNNKVQDVFLGMIRVTSTTAENLMKAIEDFLLVKGIPVDKAIMVGFDGCNTMSGENKGLQRRFRHVVPHQLYVHCRNHRRALCVKHLVKEYPVLGHLDDLLMAVWKLFAYSPLRFAVFEDVQAAYGLTSLSFIKAVTTRWLSHGRACRRLLDRFGPILDALDTLYSNRHEPEILGVGQMLADKKTIASAAVLCDILAPLVYFSDYLQGDVQLNLVNDKLKEVIDRLHRLIERFRHIGHGHQDEDLQFSKVESFWSEIDDRTELARRLRGPREVQLEQFTNEFAIPVVYSLIGEIEDAFRCSEILQSISVFGLANVPDSVTEVAASFGKDKIKLLANHYGKMKEDTFLGHRNTAYPVYPAEQILVEFEGFKHQMHTIKRTATVEQLQDKNYLLQKVICDPQLSADYPSMAYLLLCSHLVPVSTAVVERVFSLMNSICTPLRSSLKQSTLDCIIRIVHSGASSLSAEQLEKAVTHFASMKDRVLDF